MGFVKRVKYIVVVVVVVVVDRTVIIPKKIRKIFDIPFCIFFFFEGMMN